MAYINRKERYELVGFNDTKLILVAVPFFAIPFPFLVFGINPLENFDLYFISFLIAIMHIAVYWYVERWMVLFLRKKYHRIEEYGKRIVIQSILLIFSTLILCLISETPEFCFNSIPPAFDVPFYVKYVASLIITTIIISLYEGAYSFQLFKRGLIANEELRRKNTQAQLESLKNQVNPHFLFNSLNTLISVIPEDSDTAVKFAENLSSVYRYILEIKDKELITLEEELTAISAYQYLLSIRFGNHIKFEFENLNDTQNNYIIPLSIQMLVENAIKHNVVSKERPLTISVIMEEGMLRVCNNLQLKTKTTASTGIGLKNIKKRYELLAGKSIQVEESDDIFCVHLPILKMKEVK